MVIKIDGSSPLLHCVSYVLHALYTKVYTAWVNSDRLKLTNELTKRDLAEANNKFFWKGNQRLTEYNRVSQTRSQSEEGCHITQWQSSKNGWKALLYETGWHRQLPIHSSRVTFRGPMAIWRWGLPNWQRSWKKHELSFSQNINDKKKNQQQIITQTVGCHSKALCIQVKCACLQRQCPSVVTLPTLKPLL